MNKLSTSTVRQISSGQVISEIHCVVKELVENAIDAKATRIEVNLQNFGLDKIEVTDNGTGISEEDAAFFAQRHYTSKLSSFEDLTSVNSYGFRGEGVASICVVADVHLVTKTENDKMARSYVFNHSGVIVTQSYVAAKPGSTMQVSRLFSNLPVRRHQYRGLRRLQDSLTSTEKLLLSYAIAHPTIHFYLSHGMERVFSRPACRDRHEAVRLVLGRQRAEALCRFQIQRDEVNIDVFVPRPGTEEDKRLFGTTPRLLFVIVNERPVEMPEFHKLARQLSKDVYQQQSRYPTSIWYIDMPVRMTDINLDPNKTRITFIDMTELLEWLLLDIQLRLSSEPKKSEKMLDAMEADPMAWSMGRTGLKHPTEIATRGDIDSGAVVVSSVEEQSDKLRDQRASGAGVISNDERHSNGRIDVEVNAQLELINSNVTTNASKSLEAAVSAIKNYESQFGATEPSKMAQSGTSNSAATSERLPSTDQVPCDPPAPTDQVPCDPPAPTDQVPCDPLGLGVKASPEPPLFVAARGSDSLELRSHENEAVSRSLGSADSPLASRENITARDMHSEVKHSIGGKQTSRNSVDDVFTPPSKKARKEASSSEKRKSIQKEPSSGGLPDVEVVTKRCREYVTFSVEDLRQRLKTPKANEASFGFVVGVLNGYDACIVKEQSELVVYSNKRALEQQEENRLRQECQLPSMRLEQPLVLKSNQFLTDANMQTLSSLQTREITDTKTNSTRLVVCEPTLLWNGFRIQCLPDGGFELRRVPSAFEHSFEPVLSEILSYLATARPTPSPVWRPHSVRTHFRTEATRVARSEVTDRMNGQQLEKRFIANLILRGSDRSTRQTCWHGKTAWQTISLLPPKND